MSQRKPPQRTATRKPSRPVTMSTTSAPTARPVDVPADPSDPAPHEGRFRSWLAQERPWQAWRETAVWHDICYLSRLRAAAEPRCALTAWTPRQVSQLVHTLDPLAAPSYLISLALFLEHLHDTDQWTGGVVDLADCLTLAEEVEDVICAAAQRGVEEALDDERWNPWDDGEAAGREDEAFATLRLHRERAAAMEKAFRDIELQFGAGLLSRRAG